MVCPFAAIGAAGIRSQQIISERRRSTLTSTGQLDGDGVTHTGTMNAAGQINAVVQNNTGTFTVTPGLADPGACDGVGIFCVADGKLAEHWDVLDAYSLFRRLGTLS